MEPNKKRNYLLDNLKAILIFAVVFGHVVEYYINESFILKSIYIFIYIFHMPLFIFVSGYFSKNINKCTENIIKKLIVPYIFFNLLFYALAYIYTGKNMFSLIYPGWTLWYLISLFFWRFSLKYLIKIKNVIILSFIAGLFIGIIPKWSTVLSLSRTIAFLPFFLLGYYTKETYLNKIKRINRIVAILVILAFGVLAFYIVKNNLLDHKFLHSAYSYNETGMTTIMGIGFRAFLYIGALVFGACIISLMPKINLIFSNVGKSTMSIYVFHIYFIMIVYFIVPKWNNSIFQNILMLMSPFLITYILSTKKAQRFYIKLFDFINDLTYDQLFKK